MTAASHASRIQSDRVRRSSAAAARSVSRRATGMRTCTVTGSLSVLGRATLCSLLGEEATAPASSLDVHAAVLAVDRGDLFVCLGGLGVVASLLGGGGANEGGLAAVEIGSPEVWVLAHFDSLPVPDCFVNTKLLQNYSPTVISP